MDFKDLVINNRSCRGYDKDYVVNKDELLQMVDCARLTASSLSYNPTKYMLITKGEQADIVNNNVVFAAQLTEHLPYVGTEPEAFIILCHDYEIHDSDTRFLKDIGIIAQTILLKATEMGLAGCMIGNFNQDKLSSELGLSERYHIQLVISIGKSIENIQLVEVERDANTLYYRENGVHYTPKRKLDDVIIY